MMRRITYLWKWWSC